MKSKIFFGIATMLLLASCEETIVMEIGNETDKTSTFFSATTESAPSTRTALSSYTNDNCYSLNWSAGDAISISQMGHRLLCILRMTISPQQQNSCVLRVKSVIQPTSMSHIIHQQLLPRTWFFLQPKTS